MITKHESIDRQWFALLNDSTIIALGDCGDYEAADEIAQDMGFEPVWLIDPQMAKEWLNVFSNRGLTA